MFKKKFSKKNFSLIELLIVIAIMGALAALILPSFSDSESASKDTVCDYNQAGTLRYLNMFKGTNGVYPTGFHTGALDASASSIMTSDGAVLAADKSNSSLTTAATYNFGSASTVTQLSAEQVGSLQGAGIVSLAYGSTIAKSLANNTISVYAVNGSNGSTWTEKIDPLSGKIDENGPALTVRGVSLTDIAKAGESGYTYDEDADVAMFRGADEEDFIIVPMYVAPTMDWDHYYVDGPNASKVSISMAGKCPWGEGGQARYYIAFFKVYNNSDTPATLLATSCPDCGILESDTF